MPAKKTETAAVEAAETPKKTTTRKTKAAAPKAEPAKKTAAPAEKKTEAAEKKTAAVEKKPAARKTAAKKAEPATSVYFQYDGKEFAAKEILDRAVAAYQAAHEGVEIKSIELYVVANENAAYYVVNGESAEEFKIEL